MDLMVDVSFYRKLVNQFVDLRRYETALFWAEKVCILSGNDPRDIYTHAQCMFLLKEYHRAAYTIQVHELEKSSIACYNLLLESLYEAKELTEAVSVITNVDVEYLTCSLINQPITTNKDCNTTESIDDQYKNETLASIYYLKGKIYEAADNRGLAMDFYVQALLKSIYCYEALDALLRHEMLTDYEEKELMHHLQLALQSTGAERKFITKLYESKLKKYYDAYDSQLSTDEGFNDNSFVMKSILELNKKIKKSQLSKYNTPKQFCILSPGNRVLEDLKNTPFSLQVSLSKASSFDTHHRAQPHNARNSIGRDNDTTSMISLETCFDRIQKSTDMMAAEAEKYFYSCEYKKSISIINELLKKDPYHNAGLTVQVGCLVEFGDYNKLFYVAHKLIDRYPDKAIAWYAVGCYYDLIGKSDHARRYLSKATCLDRLYGPAWLAYGHSFAKENEHDQAMAAYFKATQLMRGCHLPLLYIGVECGLTKNLELAEKFFYQAMSIAPLDVFVLHELGVIKYEFEYFESAEEVFRTTVNIITERSKRMKEEISSRWEPLFNNLGHCCRKTKKYKEALQYHQYALLLKPQHASTYTAIGFVHALMGNLPEAVTYFHKSLAINRDCIVTSTILKTCVEDLMEEEDIATMLEKGENSSSFLFSKCKQLSLIDDPSSLYSCTKLKFNDKLPSTTENIDSSIIMDISMDIL